MAGMIMIPLKRGGGVELYLAQRMSEDEVRRALVDESVRVTGGPSILLWTSTGKSKKSPLECTARGRHELHGVVRIVATGELAIMGSAAVNLRVTAEPDAPVERLMSLIRELPTDAVSARFVFAKKGGRVELINCTDLDLPRPKRQATSPKARSPRGQTPSFG